MSKMLSTKAALFLSSVAVTIAAEDVHGYNFVEPQHLTVRCPLPADLPVEDLNFLRIQNCKKVDAAIEDFAAARAANEIEASVEQSWWQRTHLASFLCNMSRQEWDNRTAAALAVEAWGQGIMEGSQCCTLTRPPYCLATKESPASVIAAGAMFILLFAMFAGTACASFFMRPAKIERQSFVDEHPPSALESARVRPRCSDHLHEELRRSWLEASALRALPQSDDFAALSAFTFARLRDVFDFQADSVRNQFEHLLSLWRSHCALVADRAVQQNMEVDEKGLLVEALGDLHAELLEGFMAWRSSFAQCACTGAAEPSMGSIFGDVRAAHSSGSTELHDSLPLLVEVAAFLLVWGEAGNVRFMPEVLYFLTELVLASKDREPESLYGMAARPTSQSNYQSSLFLAKVVRPIYNTIFDEWYDCVDVDDAGRDIKRLRRGFENFLPPDAANYDDWNELFCKPERMTICLTLDDGTPLFEVPHDQRFAALRQVDWTVSLDRYETKTHREVHSLWGIFASTHRVWLLHAVVFVVCASWVSGKNLPPHDHGVLLQGNTDIVRLSIVGLLVPCHGIMWTFACWLTMSHTAQRWHRTPGSFCRGLVRGLLFALPVATYAGVRYLEATQVSLFDGQLTLDRCLMVHFAVSFLGLFLQLLTPGRRFDKLWELTPVPLHKRLFRYVFWILLLVAKMVVAKIIFQAVVEEIATLELVRLAREPISEISAAWFSPRWGAQVLEWLLLWSMSFFLFTADTGIWYQVGCTVVGVPFIFARRHQFAIERSLKKIPERFSSKVFAFAERVQSDLSGKNPVCAYFPPIWDRIIEHMRHGDKCTEAMLMEQSFRPVSKETRPSATTASTAQLQDLEQGTVISDLTTNVGPSRGASEVGSASRASSEAESLSGSSSSDGSSVNKVPAFFKKHSNKSFARMGLELSKRPENPEMRWRINSLSRSLSMNIPSPYRAPYIPGLTVLIPHYREDILMSKDELYSGHEDTVPLVEWVKARYGDEWHSFASKMQASGAGSVCSGAQWDTFTEEQWESIGMWASMRLQTLWRTVAGISSYQDVLQWHYEAQADERSALAREDVWKASDCFTCVVAMQLYKTFSRDQLSQTNKMFETFPSSLQVAFIDWTDKSSLADADGVHSMQKRRYFSCLIDRGCEVQDGGHRKPRLQIELPGFPILGDGKSDNQNHAIPFARGSFCQCIDANQGAYFEQMLLLPCVLGEFRTQRRGDAQAKRIIGLPEHITSDFGSVGDFAAGSELAFGTVLQRSHALLGARMHYGHPDIMNKQYMIQQGGVSKATKTVNLSEDIFAGMDFMLRGNGRTIRHCEYFYLTKGRDLGFNAVMGFFSKISSGCGEQILTRQMFRLGQIMSLPDSLSFFYAHAGYYITHAFISWSMPVIVFTWLLVLSASCEDTFRSFMVCTEATGAEAMASVLSAWCSWVLIFFLAAQSLPLFTQMWMEMGFGTACKRFALQWLTCSWCFFIFQAKLVGFYVMNEIRYGGATYVSTGRGLPTTRRPFIGRIDAATGRLENVGGLYLDYAMHAHYDGVKLFLGTLTVLYLGGFSGFFAWLFIGLTIVSWLYAPCLFNPYQFCRRYFADDVRSWFAFFFSDGSRHWVNWYEETQLKPRRGFRHSIWDISCFLAYFALAVWFSVVNVKLNEFEGVFRGSSHLGLALPGVMLLPPIFLSLVYCALAAFVEDVASRCAKQPDAAETAVAARAAGGGVCAPERTMATGSDGIPLMVSTMFVLVFEALEIVAPLYGFYVQGWKRAFSAGVILKLISFSLVLFVSEGLLKSQCFAKFGCVAKPLAVLVHANRLARDVLTSALIFSTLSIGVVFNSINDALCPSFNLHQLLIYRARPLRSSEQ